MDSCVPLHNRRGVSGIAGAVSVAGTASAEAEGETPERGPGGGGAISRWREYMLYLMDHSILPLLEGAAAGAREGSV
jgi:hypothetical protein